MSLDPELRPVLRPTVPLLHRSGGDLQIGLGPEAVIIADPGGRWRELLERCRGTMNLEALSGRSSDEDPAAQEIDAVLARLARQELLDLVEPATRLVRQRYRGRLIGAGPLGSAVGRLLADTEFHTLYVVDTGPPRTALDPDSAARHQSAAFCATVRGARPVEHWSKPEGVDVAVTVVAADTLESDRGPTDDLVRADQPHLIVRPLPYGVVVGPLVVPGRTACLRCCDLHRRDRDPDWPLILAQLTHIQGVLDPVILAWGAAVAATQITGFLAGHDVETLSATLELSSTDHRLQWRSWPLHPDCGCHW